MSNQNRHGPINNIDINQYCASSYSILFISAAQPQNHDNSGYHFHYHDYFYQWLRRGIYSEVQLPYTNNGLNQGKAHGQSKLDSAYSAWQHLNSGCRPATGYHNLCQDWRNHIGRYSQSKQRITVSIPSNSLHQQCFRITGCHGVSGNVNPI